nr:glycosyltransferase family 2 protein [Prevotella sp.]
MCTQENKPLVSLVLPVYGVEKYIEQCAKSMFEQTYSNIEYIFVDDKTQDASIDKLESVMKDYPERSKQVTIVRKPKNEGTPQARRTGMEFVHGQYIMLLDSDDWVDKDMVSDMVQEAELHHADIVYTDYYINKGVNFQEQYLFSNITVKSGIELMKAVFEGYANGCLWGKMYKNELFNGIEYSKGWIFEDMVMNIQLIPFASKVVHISKPYYHYRTFLKPTSSDKLNSALQNISYIANYIQEKKLDSLKRAFLQFIEKRKMIYLGRLGLFRTPYSKYLWTLSPKREMSFKSIIKFSGWKGLIRYIIGSAIHKLP